MKVAGKTAIPEIALDRGRPLQPQLVESLRRMIGRGRACRGLRLPSSRRLARALGVSRNTVLFAYEELASRGLLVGRVGSGTRVAAQARAALLADPDGNTLHCSGLGRDALR